MFITAMIIYAIMSFITGPLWPLELLSGKGGFLGRIVVVAWATPLIAGITS
jgi:hypothetical protein